ncbi:MAG: DUF3825 domain-containing protein [Clostridia bacterium]|nr:DUF3825 domain-containing protein [Clostridia bacterium]
MVCDLFEFAYIPNWDLQLDDLAEMALPEPWRFCDSDYSYKNTDNPILERYLQCTFRKLAVDYNNEPDKDKKQKIFYFENEFSCFNTGLYTRQYKEIYACFKRNHKTDTMLRWYFRGFADECSPMLRYVFCLPERPLSILPLHGIHYFPDHPIRVNIDHILGDSANVERLPESIRDTRNLPLLLETAVELARRQAIIVPSIVVPQIYQQRVQYLLPLCLTDMETPDLAMTLCEMDGYYIGSTCLTLQMAYLNARLLARPTAPWLVSLVEE